METERIAEAFNWTVVFLMAMPYATLDALPSHTRAQEA